MRKFRFFICFRLRHELEFSLSRNICLNQLGQQMRLKLPSVSFTSDTHANGSGEALII